MGNLTILYFVFAIVKLLQSPEFANCRSIFPKQVLILSQRSALSQISANVLHWFVELAKGNTLTQIWILWGKKSTNLSTGRLTCKSRDQSFIAPKWACLNPSLQKHVRYKIPQVHLGLVHTSGKVFYFAQYSHTSPLWKPIFTSK